MKGKCSVLPGFHDFSTAEMYTKSSKPGDLQRNQNYHKKCCVTSLQYRIHPEYITITEAVLQQAKLFCELPQDVNKAKLKIQQRDSPHEGENVWHKLQQKCHTFVRPYVL